MSCTTCYSHICTCDNEKFCDGPKGERGDRGDQGTPGQDTPDGVRSVYIDTDVAETQRFPDIDYNVISYTVTEPGDYLMMFESDTKIFIDQTSITYKAVKNNVLIPNAVRALRGDALDELGENKIKKNKMHVGIPSLIVGDIISIIYTGNRRYFTMSKSLTMLKTTQLTVL